MSRAHTRRLLIGFVTLFFGTVAAHAADDEIKLPLPAFKGKVSVEAAMFAKKTVRNFKKTPLTLPQVSQMLWAANGSLPADAISGATAKVIPSAGGLYPLEAFLVAGKNTVTGVPEGVYRYVPQTNSLKTVTKGDNRALLAYAALSQSWLANAPALIVIGGVFDRTMAKYGGRGLQYVFMEAGSSCQNVYLQAEAIGLHVGTVGAFDEKKMGEVLKLPKGVTPLLIVAVGE